MINTVYRDIFTNDKRSSQTWTCCCWFHTLTLTDRSVRNTVNIFTVCGQTNVCSKASHYLSFYVLKQEKDQTKTPLHSDLWYICHRFHFHLNLQLFPPSLLRPADLKLFKLWRDESDYDAVNHISSHKTKPRAAAFQHLNSWLTSATWRNRSIGVLGTKWLHTEFFLW